MKLIYIAGPYSAPTTWGIDENIARARRYGAFVAQHVDAYPIIPHSNTAHMDGLKPYEFWLEGTMEALRRCDGAVFIWEHPNMPKSKGTADERKLCADLGIPTMTLSLEHPGDDYPHVNALKAWFATALKTTRVTRG